MEARSRKTITAILIAIALFIAGAFGIGNVSAQTEQEDPAIGALHWAIDIANDDSFAFGSPKTKALHTGCYYCGTNITGPKQAKEGSKWEKTYCSNTFVFSAYAHGGNIESMLKACQSSKNAATQKSLKKHGFVKKGKIKFAKLKPGDIVIHKNGTMWMYVGKTTYADKTYGRGAYVIAAGGGWGADSISVKETGAKKKYKSASYVMRYSPK